MPKSAVPCSSLDGGVVTGRITVNAAGLHARPGLPVAPRSSPPASSASSAFPPLPLLPLSALSASITLRDAASFLHDRPARGRQPVRSTAAFPRSRQRAYRIDCRPIPSIGAASHSGRRRNALSRRTNAEAPVVFAFAADGLPDRTTRVPVRARTRDRRHGPRPHPADAARAPRCRRHPRAARHRVRPADDVPRGAVRRAARRQAAGRRRARNRAADGFAAQLPLELVPPHAGRRVPWLAIEDPAHPWPKLPGKQVSAGPFYLVWPDASSVRGEQWPYQIVRVTIESSPLARWPSLAVDAALPRTIRLARASTCSSRNASRATASTARAAAMPAPT